MSHNCNHNTQKAEAKGALWTQGKPELQSEALFQNKKKIKSRIQTKGRKGENRITFCGHTLREGTPLPHPGIRQLSDFQFRHGYVIRTRPMKSESKSGGGMQGKFCSLLAPENWKHFSLFCSLPQCHFVKYGTWSYESHCVIMRHKYKDQTWHTKDRKTVRENTHMSPG